jgi:AraC-like DNA-binding protein
MTSPDISLLLAGSRLWQRPGVASVAISVSRTEETIRNLGFPTLCLLRLDGGHKELIVGERQIALEPGQWILLGPQEAVTAINRPAGNKAYRATAILFDPVIVEKFANLHADLVARSGKPRLFHRVSGNRTLLNAFEEALGGLRADGQASARLAEHHLLALLLIVAEAGLALVPGATLDWRQRVRAIITSDPAADWRAGEVAGLLGTSEATLRRHLAAQDTSFATLLTDARLDRGFTALAFEGASVIEAAFAAGYRSPSRFSDAFKARFGLLPSRLKAASQED